ncbi:MAG: DNA polymerase IV [Clostridia bacterium]|nr:DNA polymerase IV [Clostridia bacterium]
MYRSILHCDMNNFYASVECRMDPTLRGRPVAVCGETEDRHGIVLAKNYEAKAYGVATGEAVWQAKRKCPRLVIVPPHYDEYVQYSRAARQIYECYTDQIEPLGLDECWLDVTGSEALFGSGERIAHEIRERIKSELGITASVGVSFNKVFAKLGSDMKKPDAVTVITPERFREEIWHLPASDMLGVGRATDKKLCRLGIHTIGDLARYPCACLRKKFGKCGEDIWRYANGLDVSRVVTRQVDDLDKTAGHGITAREDLIDNGEVWVFLLELAQNVGHRLRLFEKRARGVAVAIRDVSLSEKQWQCRLPYPTQSPYTIAEAGLKLFEKNYNWFRPIRSVSIRAIDLVSEDVPQQLDVFTDARALEKRERLDGVVESLRGQYGSTIIRNAILLNIPKMPGHDVLNRKVQLKGT